MTLNEIEKLAQRLAEAREELTKIITRLQRKQQDLADEVMPDVRKLVGKSAAHHSLLYTGIDGSRNLFEQPKTQIFHGIKVGLRKGAGGITWDDEDAVIARAEKRFSKEQCELIIKTEKTLRKKALGSLDVPDLKAIGCGVEEAGDVVMIKPVDAAVDKIVNSLLKAAVDEAQKEAA